MNQIAALAASLLKGKLIKRFKESKDFDAHLLIAEQFIKIMYDEAIDKSNYDLSIPPPEHEIWRPVKGYEGIYEISSCGRIKCLERFFIKKNSRSQGKKAVYRPEMIRVKKLNMNGYVNISLWNNNAGKHKLVHRLVAEHFIHNPFPKKHKQVLHKDNNPANAKWDNLYLEQSKQK